jgi:hypothetical protein
MNHFRHFRYCIETMYHDIGLQKVYTDDVDTACDFCVDLSKDYQTEYSRVIDTTNNETLKLKTS